MSVHGEGANMNQSFSKNWPILIALFVSAIAAASVPALAQQQAALATPSNSLHAIHAASNATDGAAKSDAAAAQAAFNRA